MDEVIAIAEKNGEVYEYRGANATDFPVRFDGLTTDGPLTVDNHAHRITSQLNGVQFFVRPLDSDDGEILTQLADDLRGMDDTDAILSVIDEYLDMVDD